MKNIFLFLFFTLFLQATFSQNRANIWYFGHGAGLDFNSGSPTALLDGQLHTNEGCATISDNSGNLLFYTDGLTVYNAGHSIMQNGTGLRGHNSATHSAVIVPMPNSLTQYYIFTVGEQFGPDGLRYSIVDLSLDGGLGSVTTKNVLLFENVTEKIGSYKKSGSDEFWVIAQKYGSNEFMSYEVTASGVDPTPVISAVGVVNGPVQRQQGQIKISQDGRRFANATQLEVQIFDFDEGTGRIANPITVLEGPTSYGIEFSPDSNLLYVAYFEGVAQFNLGAGSEEDIDRSMVILHTSSRESFGSLQMGPDNKIYGVKGRKGALDVIHNPNALGTACDYRYDDLFLGGRLGFLGLPTFISNISILTGGILLENICYGSVTEFSIGISETVTTIAWDFGDGNVSTVENPTHTYATPGDYTVSMTASTASDTKTETKEITIYQPPVANAVTNFEVCSISPDHEFDLALKDAEVLGGQSAIDFGVEYYTSLADAQSGGNVLPIPYTNTNAIETIYARIYNVNNSACFDIADFELIVKEAPNLHTVMDWTVCDTDTDGFFDFDLSQMTGEVLNGQDATTFTINYFESQADVDANTNALGTNHTNTNSPETIFFRIENMNYPECFETGSFDLEVITAVAANAPAPMEVCDSDNDGIAVFDLSFKDMEILGGQSPTNFTVTYHTAQRDADTGANALTASNYTNTVPYSETIYARVENHGNSDCYNTTSFELVVHDSPVRQVVTDWPVCDTDNDGVFALDLTEKNSEVLGNQPSSDFTISYHETETDALTDRNAIIGTYGNTTDPQTVYYRLETAANGNCFLTDSFEIQVFDTPVAHRPTPIVACDLDGTGVQHFDLSAKDAEILDGQDPNTYSIGYFNNASDAQTNQDELSRTAYLNANMRETIYARIENGNLDGCYDITNFEIIVDPLPDPGLGELFVICPDNPELTLDGGDFETWSWYNENNLLVGTDRYLAVSELGDYSLTVSQSNNGLDCDATVFFEVVSSGAPEDFTTVIEGFSDRVTIIIDATGIGDFEYSIDGENYQDSNRLEMFPGTYTVYVRDRFLCRTISREIIALGYQKFFTPNGDGINEYWNIVGAVNYPNSMVYIQDRYGKVMARISADSRGWDGTFKGAPMPSSDYWFRYVYDNDKVVKGHFSLKR